MSAVLHNLPVSDYTRLLAALTAIVVRCDDLDALAAADGAVDRQQVRIDSARIRHLADEARRLVVARLPS
ncbi:hypothetical protein GXW74_19935 [Roseomonas eburnea]|uniref:Uncharacterized protein n=1 Tax=Neoroseomonas eburnea TaxID=1346889 RepID=A0A9X9XGD7_9PROT|nr:hypothetical protein [Neoroseomonas eburnea]MBR0682773.1 hypothetical protein [Neoroseomonas eburnea]